MYLDKCRLVLRFCILLVISQVIQGMRMKSKSRSTKNIGNGNNSSFLERVRRADEGQNVLVKITKNSAAVDQVCTTLKPCAEEEGETEEKLIDSCIEFNPFDKEPSEESVANEEKVKLCYNPDPEAKDPITIYEGETVEMTAKSPKNLNDRYDGVGFAIPEKYVFRHINGTGDIFRVISNYEEEGQLVDFQFMEWPGKTIGSLIKQQMAAQTISDVNKELGVVKECMQVLEFDGKSDKYLDYLCNTDEGLDVAALGLIPRQTSPDEKELPESCPKEKVNLKTEYTDTGEIESEEKYNRVYNLRCNLPRNRDNLASKCATWPIPVGKLYLAGGNTSLLGDYVQPLLVSEDVLRKLVQPDELSLDGEKYVPQFNEKKLECTELMSRDIRTVLDFAFSSDRLILGMKCGVLLVKNINQDKLEFDVAYMRITDRQRPRVNETNSHMFPYMINTIAASTCCVTDKMCHLYKPIVAIYSSYAAYISYPDSGAERVFETMPKFIYISTDNGDTFDRRVVASPRAELNLMYWMYAKIPKWQIKDARPPDWIKEYIIKNDLDRDTEEPVDPITSYLLQNSIPKVEVEDDDDDCYEIVSMVVVSEESLLLVLCRYKGPRYDENTDPREDPYTYGIFSIKIRGTLPLISPERRSKRKFQCTPVSFPRIWGGVFGSYRTEPTLIRVPNSYSIFVMGCRKILYYSSNGGRTMFISSFFVKTEEPEVKYERTYVNKDLFKVPMIALDSQGQSVMITYGSNFAYGVISTNTEITFVTGPVFAEDIAAEYDPVLIPFLNDAGKVGAAIIYINALKLYSEELYADRHAIRLLDCSISVHKFSLPYYSERNKDRESRETIPPCTTYNFKTNKTTMFLDVGESDAVKVSVLDTRKDTPLNILLTHDKAASLQVFGANEVTPGSQSLLLHHGWDIRVTAKPYIIPRTTAMVNAFFGASYSNLEEVSAHLIVSTAPQMRCHVQPRGHLQVRFGCSERLVIHEDEYAEDGTLFAINEYLRRPHCQTFQKNFKYEIPQGHYDEEMANYWILERPKFYEIVNGTLKITYDYEMFGCPVQPYALDPYFPDLRTLPIEGNSNTTEGELFNGSFVLIEIFGASGYSFNKKVKDKGCKQAPQTLERMMEEWKVRVEAIKSLWYDYPHFDFEAVYHPLNIWNRVNYYSCSGSQFINEEESDPEEGTVDEESANMENEELELDVRESPYEILKREKDEEQNKLIWDPTIRQEVYIFLAVAVDPYGTFCNHHTFFGLSITVPKEGEDWIVIVVFFVSLLILILLIIAGYYFRRYQVYRHFYKEAMFNHLLTAAWNLSFRYEKMLYDAKITDPEVRKEMEETRQMKNTHSGVESHAKENQSKKIDGLRHRLRQ